jgi:hypothetical protein
VAYEKYLIEATKGYLGGLKEVGVPAPLVVLVNMIGVKGAQLGVDTFYFGDGDTPIDRDVLLLPEVLIENFDCNVASALRPIFDAVWNAAGYERSFNYDESGEWKPR